MNTKKLYLLVAIITIFIFLSPISLSILAPCGCGGCCVGCPGDCSSIGAPFPIYYWGIHGFTGEEVSQLSTFGLTTDIIFWIISLAVVYRIHTRKKE